MGVYDKCSKVSSWLVKVATPISLDVTDKAALVFDIFLTKGRRESSILYIKNRLQNLRLSNTVLTSCQIILRQNLRVVKDVACSSNSVEHGVNLVFVQTALADQIL